MLLIMAHVHCTQIIRTVYVCQVASRPVAKGEQHLEEN
ncbi:MAG: hypothetical protein ACI82A_004305 [Candidatus Azotimanducaceae bacterium]|jgi:hypothetical protein